MPRPNRGIESLIGGPCKIRKRGLSSSSSSSSVLQNYRFKRAILVGKRAGSSTPVPTWKMTSRSPSSIAGVAESPKHQPSQASMKAKQLPVSARKLAATLWELNEIPSPRAKEDLQERRARKEIRGGRERVARSAHSGSLPPHLSDPSHSPVSEAMDRSTSSSLRRRMSIVSQRIRHSERVGGGLDAISNASLMEIETRSRGVTPSSSVGGGKSRLRDVSNGLTTSKELLKILNRIWGLEEQHSSSMSLVSALRVELERARVQVDQLIQEQKSDRDEINYLMKRFAEEKAAWKSKEKDKISAAVQSIAADLEVERKLRRRTENMNARLSGELAETKSLLSKALKELQSERREREILEQVCEELARGIGEDRQEVEELKRQSEKVREEVEKEREMLQIADVWREERVQMKLSEAKLQFEEKNAAVDKLRTELEAYLRTKRMTEMDGGHQNQTIDNGDLSQLINLSKKAHLRDDEEPDEGEVENGDGREDESCDDNDNDDSAESDLHSIELNMDNNSRSYKWTYTNGNAQQEAKRSSVDEETKGRKSSSEKIQKGVSLDRSLSEGIEWDFSTDNHWYQSNGTPDQGRFLDGHKKQALKEHYNDEAHQYKSVKGLRDQILSGTRIASAQGFSSPTRLWSPRWPSHDPVDERLKVGEKVGGMGGSKGRSGEATGEGLHLRYKQAHSKRCLLPSHMVMGPGLLEKCARKCTVMWE